MMHCEQITSTPITAQLPEYRIIMPQGIIGFNDIHHYTLTPLNSTDETSLFWELQSVEEASCSFILMHLEQLAIKDIVIAETDFTVATKHLGVSLDECHVFLIVAIEVDATGQKTMTVNIRAPFVYQQSIHKAWQVILPNSDYPIAQII